MNCAACGQALGRTCVLSDQHFGYVHPECEDREPMDDPNFIPPPFNIENCTACGRPMPTEYCISYDHPGHFHRECVPLPARVQAEEEALKAKPPLPGRKITRAEANAAAFRIMDEAETRRAEAVANDPGSRVEPNPYAPLAAKIREMKRDFDGGDTQTIGEKWFGRRRGGFNRKDREQLFWLEGYLSAAADLAKLLPEETE